MDVHTNTGELQRVAIDAFRGLGYSFALADRFAHTLTWAEAVHRCGCRFLRLNEDRIVESSLNTFRLANRRIGAVEFDVLHAAGKNLFESGPRAFDLANANARTGGNEPVLIEQTFGGFVIGEFVMQSMERNLGAFAIVHPECGRIALAGDFEAPRVILGVPGKGCREATVNPAALSDILADRIRMPGLFRPFMACFDALGLPSDPKILFEKPERARPGLSDISLVSFARSGGGDRLACIDKLFEEAALASGLWLIDDVARRWADAVNYGFEMNSADWQALFSFVARTRIPTSERSRSQAG